MSSLTSRPSHGPTSQHVHKVTQRVHDGEGQQEDRRTHGAVAVVVQLEVASESFTMASWEES